MRLWRFAGFGVTLALSVAWDCTGWSWVKLPTGGCQRSLVGIGVAKSR